MLMLSYHNYKVHMVFISHFINLFYNPFEAGITLLFHRRHLTSHRSRSLQNRLRLCNRGQKSIYSYRGVDAVQIAT